ncbi:hypothetical protein PIB30_081890 [Stylosanthes scabra]|uniref:Succinate dehydrogenase subunit 4 n=1 Tax=Stylosanthes scabra TaxID=79078 RepID=A0ABU6VT28_9FABA|nr:hypothetical protein [Stylosanthes scabra]
MQSLSLTLTKKLSSSKPLFSISPNLLAHSSTISSSSSITSPPPSPPISAEDGASSFPSLALHTLLRAPWSATQSRGISVPRSDVRAANLAGSQGRAYEVLKLYRPYDAMGKATVKVQPERAAGYATASTTGDSRIERVSALRNAGPKTKREQILKATALVPLFLIFPNAYTLLAANVCVFWHISAGIEEILADYVHHEMTRNYVMIALRLFLIIAMKDVFVNFVFV